MAFRNLKLAAPGKIESAVARSAGSPNAPLGENAPVKFRSVKLACELVRDDIRPFSFGARAGQSLAGRQLYSATVWELDVSADEWPATFKNILCANRKPRWQMRGSRHV